MIVVIPESARVAARAAWAAAFDEAALCPTGQLNRCFLSGQAEGGAMRHLLGLGWPHDRAAEAARFVAQTM